MNELTSDEQLRSAADLVSRTARSAAQQELEQDERGARIQQFVANAHQMTDSLLREIVDLGPADQRPVCCEGCNACCYLHVVATPVEVLAASTWMRTEMSSQFLSEVTVRIDEHIKSTSGLDAAQRRTIRPVCPLLEAGRCSIYSVRPTSCRGWNSLDRSPCDADLANPAANTVAPVNLGQVVLAGRVAEAMNAASDALGLESRQLDFIRGLRIALDNPTLVAQSWRSGADVFADSVNENVFPGPKDPEEEQTRKALWGSSSGTTKADDEG